MLGLSPLSGEVSGSQTLRKLRRRSLFRMFGMPLGGLAMLPISSLPSFAQRVLEAPGVGQASITTPQIIQFSVLAGIVGAACISVIGLNRLRSRAATENRAMRSRISELSSALARSEALLQLKDQRVIVWPMDGGQPSIIGDLAADSGAPLERSSFLTFSRWLTVQSAAELERLWNELCASGSGFDLLVETTSGTLLEVQGRRAAMQFVLRFSSFSRIQAEIAQLKRDMGAVEKERHVLLELFNAIEMPVWLRDADGKLEWVNQAYADALGASDAASVLQEGRDLLPAASRARLMQAHLRNDVYREDVSITIADEASLFAVTDAASDLGSAGIAIDRSELDALRQSHDALMRSHADTLDQLTTAVATFDHNQQLVFWNQAFEKLWSLDRAFLQNLPENALVLDKLRSTGKIAEHPEWRRWKDQVLSAYRETAPNEHWWHLPDGRTIRVIANPQPKGGVTWIFENLTEQISLESRYNTIVRVQGETLDNLAEGVAVFGPDGRMRLCNPAFRNLWDLPEKLVEGDVHISLLKAASDALARQSPWGDFVAAATGLDYEREDRHGQTELTNGTALRYAVIHLPNGQTMLTFVDVTDSVKVERALKDKNEALERADRLKNDFVQHVSYELRSPLTNIIGFTELLSLEQTGPLTQRQREYVGHIGSSSELLLTVVNDILDLATVDAGIMELDLGEVAVGDTVYAAARLVEERLAEHSISLQIELDPAARSFYADENRVRQILYNLLSNAANYAPDHGRILLSARQTPDEIIFRVHDNGPGMSTEVLQSIFKRFETRSNGGRRRGAGLGLSIVKSFVELHGGTVQIETSEGWGTAVTCRFPVIPAGMRVAAE